MTVLSSFFAWVGPVHAFPAPPQDELRFPLRPIGGAEFWTSAVSYIPQKDAPWLWLLYAMKGYTATEIAIRFRRNRSEVEKAIRQRMTRFR